MTRHETRTELAKDLERYERELRKGRNGTSLNERTRERREKSVTRIKGYIEILDRWDEKQPSRIGLSQAERTLINVYEISDAFPGQFRYSPVR